MEESPTLKAGQIFARINPEKRELEFSNGNGWHKRKLLSIDFTVKKCFKTDSPGTRRKTYAWEFMREVPPARKMTVEEIENEFNVKIIF